MLLALLRDGFHEKSPGAQVMLRSDGSPVLDCPLNDFVMEDLAGRCSAWRRSSSPLLRAKCCLSMNGRCLTESELQHARRGVQALPMKPVLTKVVSAHVMGRCGFLAPGNSA